MAGRRSNGEGSLRRMTSRDLYQYRWTEWVDGGSVRRSGYAKTRAAGVAGLRTATTRAAAGRVGADSTGPLRVVAARWQARAPVAQQLAGSTIRRYAEALDRHVLPRLGDVPLREVKPSQVSDVLVAMDRAGLGPSSQAHVLCALRAVYRLAAADDPWLRDPTAGLRPPRKVPAFKVVPTRGQVTALLAAAPDPRSRALVAVLAYTGCGSAKPWRCGGPTGSNPPGGTGRLELRHTKTGRPRAVLVAPKLARHLRAWRRAQTAARLAAPAWADEGWILASDTGTHWDHGSARRRIERLADGQPDRGQPGICPGATPHSLRHAAATILLEDGVPMRVVADLLGHASTHVTEDTYSHVTPRLSAQATAVLNQAI